MKVLVVGAGISGLRTAQLLERAGVEVEVYEARERVGGRMLTCAVEGGGYFEGGGEWIDADHRRVLALMREFGVAPERSSQWPGIVLKNGEFRTEDSVWPDAEADAAHIHDEAVGLCRRMPERPWEDAEWASLDGKRLSEWLDLQCVSERGRWWVEAVTRSDEGDDTSAVGLLGWLVGYRHYLDREEGDMSLYRIGGGGGRLCETMAGRLAGGIRFGKVLRRVEDVGGGARLEFGDSSSAEGDRVVLTLPASVMGDVELVGPAGAIGAERRAAWAALGMARAVKVALRFRSRWWAGRGWAGRMMADLPFMQMWDTGRDGAPVLAAYVCGSAAVELMGRVDPVDLVARALAEVFPEASDEFLGGEVVDWVNDPWSRGAFTCLAPGSVVAALPVVSRAWGRVHFAGEHTGGWVGFIEGALESAERVADEVLAAGRGVE